MEDIFSMLTAGVDEASKSVENGIKADDCTAFSVMDSKDDGKIRRYFRIRVRPSSSTCALLTGSLADFLSSIASSSYAMPEQFVKNVLSLGHSRLTPVQMQTIPLLMNNQEVMVCAPTGSGKTLSYLLPLTANLITSEKEEPSGFEVLLLLPTQELAGQIFAQWDALCGGLRFKPLLLPKLKPKSLKIFAKRMLKKGSLTRYKVLISTPNRLLHSLDILRDALTHVRWLVLDEADKLFEATSKRCFREQLPLILSQLYSTDKHLKLALFSATYAQSVDEWCCSVNEEIVRVNVGKRNTAVSSVKQKLVYCGNEDGKLIGLRNLLRSGYTPPILVFVATKQRANELLKELLYDGLMVAALHSDLTDNQRKRIVDAFISKQIWLLICTDVLGRGMDFENVSLVVNYDVPPDAVTYIHRVGRTGRALKEGHACTFFTDSDIPEMRSIVGNGEKG